MIIVNPTLPDDQEPAEVTDLAFRDVWEPRGWTEAPERPDPKLVAPVPVRTTPASQSPPVGGGRTRPSRQPHTTEETSS